jgi:metal-responsive CopG/Arc/MetJ family transcriptional regulator
MLKQTPYRARVSARRERENPQRLVVFLPQADLARIDDWGIAAGKNSRSETVRALINKSLGNQEKHGSD